MEEHAPIQIQTDRRRGGRTWSLHLRPMAPRKTKSSSAPAWYEPALEAPTVTEKSLASARLLTVGESNEWGKMELRLASDEPEAEGSTFFPFFSSNIAVGLVPPFSDFFYEVLDHYGLRALHLHPKSVLLLSIFAYYCEAYLGVMPSVALLRHFFFLRVSEGHISGCANFVTSGKANSISSTGKRADNIRSKWVMVDAKRAHPRLVLPTEAPSLTRGGPVRSLLISGRCRCWSRCKPI